MRARRGSVRERPSSHLVQQIDHCIIPVLRSDLAACGPEFPRLWEREERGGEMWDAGREKVP